MRYLLVTLTLLISSSIYSQQISESVLTYEDSFSPLFSRESSVMSIQFVKNYEMNIGDTSFLFLISLQEKQLEERSVTLGTTIFNSNWKFGDNMSNYEIFNTNEQVVLNKDSFMEFYECIKKVHSFIGNKQKFEKQSNATVASCGGRDLIMGGEVSGKNNVNYYFKIGENSTYNMSQSQFLETVKVFKKVRDLWESI